MVMGVHTGSMKRMRRPGVSEFCRETCGAVFWTKKKGCDFGYALADNSCERVPGVDACTVAALDVITAFTVPDLG